MMDPLSAIGALAAASQLAEQCLRITIYICELRSHARHARSFVENSAQHVDQLIRMSRQIILNPSLQTETISEVLKPCLKDAQSLCRLLQDLSISSKDSRVDKLKKTLEMLRKRRLIEDRSRDLDRWKGLLTLCITETNSNDLRAVAKDIQVVLERSHINDTSTSNVMTLVETLPGIFTQVAAIESRLRSQQDNFSEVAVASSELSRNLESIMQHLSVCRRRSIARLHFGSNVLTHYFVPIPRNQTFRGFEDTIEKLKQQYSSGSRSSERILTLTGVACGGKTQAAVEFCQRAQSAQQFGAIFWIKTSSAKAIAKSFGTIASKLNVAEGAPIEARIETTMTILKAWPCPWLMVFDNYNGSDHSNDIGRYMPDSEQGSYLLTRKLEDLTPAEKSAAVHLPGLQLGEALELLYNRSAVEKNDESFVQGTNLVHALGKIPRVIMQVGLYIKKRKIGFDEYRGLLRQLDKRGVAALLDSWGLSESQRKLARIRIEDYISGGC